MKQRLREKGTWESQAESRKRAACRAEGEEGAGKKAEWAWGPDRQAREHGFDLVGG